MCYSIGNVKNRFNVVVMGDIDASFLFVVGLFNILNAFFKGVIFLDAQNKGEGIEISYRCSMGNPSALGKGAD